MLTSASGALPNHNTVLSISWTVKVNNLSN